MMALNMQVRISIPLPHHHCPHQPPSAIGSSKGQLPEQQQQEEEEEEEEEESEDVSPDEGVPEIRSIEDYTLRKGEWDRMYPVYCRLARELEENRLKFVEL